MGFDLQQICDAVQFNCDVADANFAGNYTMCTYLLKMRELYRWAQSIDQSEKLKTASVSEWVSEKEVYWESLENEQFRGIPVGDDEFDPFSVEQINQMIREHGLVYSAGYSRGCRPEFYLGSLDQIEHYDSYDVMISGHEYARDLSASVAMTQGEFVYVRQESIRRMLWEQIEAWRWRRSPAGALANALSQFPLDSDPAYTLEQLLKVQIEYVINHEIGEVAASGLLGEDWKKMMMQHSGTRLEFIARAIKDHLADAMITLPALIYSGNATAIHLYFANLQAIRETLFPQLVNAYSDWCDTGSFDHFKRLIRPSQEHWAAQAERLLDDFNQQGDSLSVGDEVLDKFQPAFSVH